MRGEAGETFDSDRIQFSRQSRQHLPHDNQTETDSIHHQPFSDKMNESSIRRRGRTEEYYDKTFTEKKFWMWLGQVQIFLYLETWIVCFSILVCNIHSQTENNGCKSNVQKWDPSERRKADPVFPAGTAGFRMDNGHFLVIWNFMEWFIGASTSLAHIYIV